MIKNNFYNFYDKHNVAPVRIDKDKIKNHYLARKNLYRELCLFDELITDKEIIEFGPGTGENASFNLNFKPKKYTLIDNSQSCIDISKDFLKKNHNHKKLLFKKSKFEDFKTKKKYDLVFAENCIPNNINPKNLFCKLFKKVKSGGYFFTTCTSSLGCLSEICRKIISNLCIEENVNFEKKKKLLLNFFDKDLNNLINITRNREDWVVDNLLQESNNREMFSLDDLLKLNLNFSMVNTYPKFFQSWSWYKNNESLSIERYKKKMEKIYFKNTFNFLDYNRIYKENDLILGKKLHKLANITFEISKIKDKKKLAKKFKSNLLNILSLIDHNDHYKIYNSINELIDWLDKRNHRSLKHFRKWWGRANMHLLIKN